MTIFHTLYLLTIFIAFIFASIRFIHIFQLESYLNEQYLKWTYKNLISKALIPALPALFGGIIFAFTDRICLIFVSVVLNLLTAFFFRPVKAKKPLVYTARIKRLVFTLVIINVLITGILLAFDLYVLVPILVIICPFTVIVSAIINKPAEKAVRSKYINQAKRIIKNRKENLIVIGITGSYGKTSTKFYLEKILSKKYNVLMTPASYNTTMGVVKVVREMLKPSHEIFICEMGARNVGEIKEICDIVLPDYGIITSIGPQHLETFKSIENVIKTKFELADAVSEKGKVVLNADYSYICEHPKSEKFIYYSVDNENAGYYKAQNLSCSAKGTDFDLVYSDNKISLSTRLLGKHNVQNIVGACSLGVELGVDAADIKTSVKMLESVPHRLEIIDAGDIVIIDDAFNSNPAGSAYAIDVLSYFDGVKILVTPGMVELGTKQAELNTEFGKKAAEVCDYIYVVGKENYDSIYNGAKSGGFDTDTKFVSVNSPNEAVDLTRILPENKKKFILLENDLPDNFR